MFMIFSSICIVIVVIIVIQVFCVIGCGEWCVCRNIIMVKIVSRQVIMWCMNCISVGFLKKLCQFSVVFQILVGIYLLFMVGQLVQVCFVLIFVISVFSRICMKVRCISLVVIEKSFCLLVCWVCISLVLDWFSDRISYVISLRMVKVMFRWIVSWYEVMCIIFFDRLECIIYQLIVFCVLFMVFNVSRCGVQFVGMCLVVRKMMKLSVQISLISCFSRWCDYFY